MTLVNRLAGLPISVRVYLSLLIYGAVAAVYAVKTDGVIRDDAYIFFQYARNWFETGTLAFNPTEPSYGVTSILWTGILALSLFLVPDVIVLAKLLGVVFGSVGAYFWIRWLFERVGQPYSIHAIAIAALMPTIGAGRMVTGMETGLACLLTGLLLRAATDGGRYRGILAGLTAGLLSLTRPELSLAGFALVLWFVYQRRLTYAATATVTFAVVAASWPLWLFSRIGSFLPPTRHAKLSVFLPEFFGITLSDFEAGTVIERMSWGVQGLMSFATLSVSSAVIIALLVTTFLFVFLVRKRLPSSGFVALLLPSGLVLGLMFLYMFGFPLLKLRYFVWLVPGITVSLVLASGLLLPAGVHKWLTRAALMGLILIIIPALNHRIASTEVQQVRKDVATALRERTPPGSRIALEPIGEIGFYANRYIVDMGGLVSSQTRDCLAEGFLDVETIWDCLVTEQADYLVTYAHDGFLGRLPEKYPERFENVVFIPEEENSPVRYRILKILQDESKQDSFPGSKP